MIAIELTAPGINEVMLERGLALGAGQGMECQVQRTEHPRYMNSTHEYAEQPADLVQTNGLVHQAIEAYYIHFLEALTALDFGAAEQAMETFSRSLFRHMVIEDERMMPLYIETVADEESYLSQIEGDHRILMRVVQKAKMAFLEVRESANPRNVLVHHLTIFVRVQNVLEHHTERETVIFYPQLQQYLSAERINALAPLLRL